MDVIRVRRSRWLRVAPALAFVIRVREAVCCWRYRVRYRRALATMSEREIADIGVCWSQIAEEVDKPFWRS